MHLHRYSEHEDLEVEDDMEQMTNIRALEEFLNRKNPKLLKSIKEMIELEQEDE